MAEFKSEPVTLSVVTQLSEAITKFLSTFEDLTKVFAERIQKSEISAESQITEVSSDPIFCPPYPRNLDFVGRSDSLSQLFGLWKPGQRGRIGVCGLGGIG